MLQLKQGPGIEDAIVVGVPDQTWGKTVVAIIHTGAGFAEATARAALEADLARCTRKSGRSLPRAFRPNGARACGLACGSIRKN